MSGSTGCRNFVTVGGVRPDTTGVRWLQGEEWQREGALGGGRHQALSQDYCHDLYVYSVNATEHLKNFSEFLPAFQIKRHQQLEVMRNVRTLLSGGAGGDRQRRDTSAICLAMINNRS